MVVVLVVVAARGRDCGFVARFWDGRGGERGVHWRAVVDCASVTICAPCNHSRGLAPRAPRDYLPTLSRRLRESGKVKVSLPMPEL